MATAGDQGLKTVDAACIAPADLEFACRDGVKLYGRLRQVSKPENEGVVVLIHGRLHNIKRGPMSAIEPLLPFSTVSFDARGMGRSDGETSYNNVDQEVEDLVQVLAQLLEKLPSPRNKILAIIGHSKGAVVALQAASTHVLPCQHVIAVSPRHNSDNLNKTNSRFTSDQLAQLEREGSFVWMHYKAGSDPNNPERRPYLVTKEEVEAHADRRLDCVKSMIKGTKVLNIHGKADGTVPFDHSLRIDASINEGEAISDVILLEGVAHNWDAPGESELLAGMISAWLRKRCQMEPVRSKELIDHLGQHRKR